MKTVKFSIYLRANGVRVHSDGEENYGGKKFFELLYQPPECMVVFGDLLPA